jgi:hypothetical protein
VVNVRGEMEINNTNGDISLTNVSGSAVVNTVYGKIKADFREVSPASPMMFTSFEGDINIELPYSVNALLKMQSGKGGITSDFNIIPVKRQPVIQNRDQTKVYSLEDWITGSLNNGGPEYIIRSYNGNIIVRKNIQSGNLNR